MNDYTSIFPTKIEANLFSLLVVISESWPVTYYFGDDCDFKLRYSALFRN